MTSDKDSLPLDDKDIKLLRRVSLSTGFPDGDVYAIMCRRCGAIWTIHQNPCHEPFCNFFHAGT